jgi:hypothetical protein
VALAAQDGSQRWEVTFRPNPIQREFIRSRADADLWAARMGEGKSAGLCWAMYYHQKHNPGARHVLIRDTYENLRDTTLAEFFKWFPPGTCGEWKETTKTFKWALGEMRGQLVCTGAQDEVDATKFMSRELAAAYFDEPAPATDSGGIPKEVFSMVMSRLRQPKMNFYSAKLAENNPDETHWTYKTFVKPGTQGYRYHQAPEPENLENLPDNYYEKMRREWENAGRPDLVRRFVDGRFGYQQIGKAITPEFSPDLHLVHGLMPLRGRPLLLFWDFGLNPTTVFAQQTPLGFLHVLEAYVGEESGVIQHATDIVRPRIRERYDGLELIHIGDPAGHNREQSNSNVTAVSTLRRELGGVFRKGPVGFDDGVNALRELLRRTIQGRGVIQIDRNRAEPVFLALRGGWHRRVHRGGIVSAEAVKNIHSHVGDAMRYGVGKLYPTGKAKEPKGVKRKAPIAQVWRQR